MKVFQTTIVDGSILSNNSFCPNVMWEIQGYSFVHSLVTMNIRVWDLILGVDWMTQYSSITFDFKHMTIKLYSDGDEIVLEGMVQ